MQVLPRLFKLWPWVDPDLFHTKVKFCHRGVCMGNSENYLFLETVAVFGLKSCLKHSTKWVNEVKWVSKVKVILWPWSKITQISKLKLVFLRNSWVIWNQSSYESLWENGNKNLYIWVGSHDQDGCHAHIWKKKPLKIFFSRTNGLMHSTKWVHEVKWVSKVILWPWSKITQISKLKLVFLRNSWVIWNQSSYESLWENGNENLYIWVGSHDQDGCHAHIWKKNL